jgi:hypothetical protein
MTASADKFLVVTVTCLWKMLGGVFFSAIAIAANSAVYGFCSSLVPSATA